MISLKPCPFCGSEDIHTPELISTQLAKCPNCGAMSPLEVWNNRVGQDDFDEKFDDVFEVVNDR